METDTKQLLEQCANPTLLVANGVIAELNQEAADRQFQVGADITDLICLGLEEYRDLTEGSLCLALVCNDIKYPAWVIKTEKYDIFRLETQYEDPTLRALALAAKHLRQPLANAMVCADDLDPADNDAKQLKRSLYQLHRAIGNMSDVAKYHQHETACKESVNISAYILETVEKAADMLKTKGITVEYTIPRQPIIGSIHCEQIQRALLNLLSNAAKFSSREGKIKVSLTQKSSKLYLTVENQGDPIGTPAQSDLFARYLRAPALEDGRFGIGLGLTMVRNAALSHGGVLLLESAPDKQKFTLSISLESKSESTLSSPVLLPVDYAGGYDHTLLELSDILPADLY